MIDELKPYPDYRQSQTWISALPSGWSLTRIQYLFREVDVRSGTAEGNLLSLTRARGLIPQADATRRIASVADLSSYKVCRPGDLVMNRMQAWSGMFAVSSHQGLVSPDYAVFQATGATEVRYFEYLFKSPLLVSQFAQLSKGIGTGFNRLYTEDFGRIPVPLPLAVEQQAIVRFLDHADRRIRRYIRAKQKLIKLLEEQREQIIHQAVTRGLNLDVQLKPSGVDWPGEIPEQWHVERFKDRVAFQEGPGIMAADFRDEGVPLLRISCLAGDVATLDGCNFLDPEMVSRRWSHFSVSPGDYLLSASGSLGAVSRATEAVAGSIPYTGIIRLWPRREGTVLMEYVRYFMASELFAAQVRFMKAGVGIEHFGPRHLNRMFLLIPPLSEQEALVADLERRTASQRAAIEAAKQEIALLREFRTRLISDVVTGKLDVREAAATLPHLLDEEPAQGALDEDATSLDGDDADAEALDSELQEA